MNNLLKHFVNKNLTDIYYSIKYIINIYTFIKSEILYFEDKIEIIKCLQKFKIKLHPFIDDDLLIIYNRFYKTNIQSDNNNMNKNFENIKFLLKYYLICLSINLLNINNITSIYKLYLNNNLNNDLIFLKNKIIIDISNNILKLKTFKQPLITYKSTNEVERKKMKMQMCGALDKNGQKCFAFSSNNNYCEYHKYFSIMTKKRLNDILN